MIRFIKSKIYEKKILRNQLHLSEGLNQKLRDANKKQQEDIYKLKEKIEEFQKAEDEYIFNAEELNRGIDELTQTNIDLIKRLKEVDKNMGNKDEVIDGLKRELEYEQDKRTKTYDALLKTEKKLTRERNKNSKLNIELLQTKNINKELINKVNISTIARHQLKELCKYNENNNKEPDRVKRPGVLVNKQVSGVKVYELANLM
ncbi:hypothetical protein UMC2_37591 [[Clostridium] sordellii]|uniref:hypothetical protein n=1 Tax=Paraclostridium sordellii TaxID=1505 RepID=UPI0005420DC8|nr:hypothetical protein [Paeniclostridium sordellii]CEK34548.1 hypothetical protein UMC2_37591 [[Clostridium] sordellii] [Paeniclostridium sordellii]